MIKLGKQIQNLCESNSKKTLIILLTLFWVPGGLGTVRTWSRGEAVHPVRHLALVAALLLHLMYVGRLVERTPQPGLPRHPVRLVVVCELARVPRPFLWREGGRGGGN